MRSRDYEEFLASFNARGVEYPAWRLSAERENGGAREWPAGRDSLVVRENGPVRITRIIWLEEILDKIIRKHHVQEHEVIEVFENRPKFRFVENGHRTGEHVYSVMGQTEAGRYLIVFFVHKSDGRALPVSAREMTDGERKRYERR